MTNNMFFFVRYHCLITNWNFLSLFPSPIPTPHRMTYHEIREDFYFAVFRAQFNEAYKKR